MSDWIIIIPGAIVGYENRRWLITHLLDLENVLAKDEVTGATERLAIKDLTLPPSTGPFGDYQEERGDTELILVPDEDWQEAQRRFSIIRPLLSLPRRTKQMVAEVAGKANIHVVTLYRWIKLYEQAERVSALLPTHRDGGRGQSRLTPEVEKILNATIEDFYLKKQKRSVGKTCKEVERRCKNAGLEPPHSNTVRKRIAALSEERKLKARSGAKAAREKFAPVLSHFPGADWPLAVIQIDHTLLDIILVDDIYRRPVGRPWIALAIDVFSRMVVGFYISFDPPDAMSVGLCIAHAILPKEKWLAKYDITTPWPCWGVPKVIHADNAKVFRGNMLKRACEEHGIDLQWRPVATPHWGGHIERLLGTFLREIHELPGTTHSNPKERGEYDSEKGAAMTLSEFEKWLATFIVEVYHQRIHSSLKMSPVRKYEEGIFGTSDKPGTGLPARITDEDRLRMDFMPYIERTIQGYGVVIEEIHYYHDVLRRYINAKDPDNQKNKRQFIFKRDPRNISQIYFYDPEVKLYYAIPYRDTSRPPMSIWELREVRRLLEKEGVESVNEQLIFDAYERMRRQEEEAVKETRKARRSRQRRAAHQQVVPPKTAEEYTPVDGGGFSPAESIPDITPFEEMEELV
ncbi:MAG TPA: Mu transposase C-terminal domain-containing protein [Pyrinomonadaceae bacterium]|jgi:putative transposase